MNTTNIIVEFLVIGIQVALWLAILILIIFGINFIECIDLKESATLVTAALVAVSYPIGIVVDNLADLFLKREDDEIRKKVNIDENSDAMTYVRISVTGDSLMGKLLEYQRMRIRLSRSTFLNFILIGILSPLFVVIRLNNILLENTSLAAGFLFIFCALIAIGAYITWQDTTRKYYKRFSEAEGIIKAKKQSSDK